jgi:protein TonB
MQHAYNRRSDPDAGIDFIRVIAISISIMVELVLLSVLMRPVSIVKTSEEPTILSSSFIIPLPLRPLPPPLIKLPVKVTLKPQLTPRLQPTLPPVVTKESNPMSKPAESSATVSGPPQPTVVQPALRTDISSAPVEASLTPIFSPPPTYPRDAIRDGSAGTVLLELLVGTDGRVLEARIVHSSGDRRLDVAARNDVLRKWRFKPAMFNGVAVKSLGRLPVVFRVE